VYIAAATNGPDSWKKGTTMSRLRLIDCHAGICLANAGDQSAPGAAIAAEMARLHIEGALVRPFPDKDTFDAPAANARLFEICHGLPALTPCPIAVPNSACDLQSEPDMVGDFIARGARCVLIRPAPDYWLPVPWVAERLFLALQDRRMPVLCLESALGLEKVWELAQRYPQLPLILAGVGYRALRSLVGLLEACPNVRVCTGGAFSIHCGLEFLAQRVGIQRLIFGTGYPETEAMAAVTMLMYSDLSPAERELVGHGNIQRLFEEVRQ